MKDRVEKVLDKIRPSIAMDGGNVELIEVEDNIVKVKLSGACHGCPMSDVTLKMGIERLIMQELPEIKEVQAV